MSLLDFFRPRRKPDAEARERTMRTFRLRYAEFKDLLQSNSELSKIMADMEEKLSGQSLFGMNYIRSQATRAVFHTMRMATALNTIANGRYAQLPAVLESINSRIMEVLESRTEHCITACALPFSEVTREQVDWVGGKSANLGEMLNRANVPIPRGFAVTTAAYQAFMGTEGLMEELRKLLRGAFSSDPEGVYEIARVIQARIAAVPVPPAVERELLASWDSAFAGSPDVRAALRSSAVSEDGTLSFAGQYLTRLNVRREGLLDAFREVVASLFSPRAITYRLHQGVPFEQCAMAMACVEMVDAVAGGVLFTRHPVDLLSEDMVVNGLWGLGAYVVDGMVPPDTWLVARKDGHAVTGRSIADKAVRLVPTPEGDTREEAVPEADRRRPCITDAVLRELAAIGLKLEQHYSMPQDVEWALAPDGRLLMLQTRPMRLADALTDGSAPTTPRIQGATLLLEGGDTAATGVGFGPVVQVNDGDDLSQFPAGAVLVAAHSSPNFVLVMDRVQAIITGAGSVTGHMASLAREFGVPTLLNVRDAQTMLFSGQEVTVDCFSRRIYAGKVDELLALRTPRRISLGDTPVHAMLRRVADQILPLHLVDPKSAFFAPQHCTSLHDVMRLVHELSYTEMFRLSDTATDAGAVAVELKAGVPLDLHVIDLGGGLKDVDGPYVYPEQVVSAPFAALLGGMLRKDVHIRGPRPIDMGGFMSVMSRHLIEPPTMQGERFGDRSYAIVSDKYLNFSSRVGYHYSVLDAYCGQTMNKNYITFQFKGGAADEVRRGRRVRCIGIILETLGFTVDVQGDRVQARFLKYPAEDIAERLDQLGRLLIVSRQMDMLMVTESAVTTFAEKFLNGDYH